MRTFLCRQCKKQRPILPLDKNTNTCLKCKLTYNKVFLLKCFSAIIDRSDMKEFVAEIEKWYV